MSSIIELQHKITKLLEENGSDLEAMAFMGLIGDITMKAKDSNTSQFAAAVLSEQGILEQYSTTHFVLDPVELVGVVRTVLTLTDFGSKLADLAFGKNVLPPFDEDGSGVTRAQYAEGYEQHVSIVPEDDEDEDMDEPGEDDFDE
jgi:hypothetical protein